MKRIIFFTPLAIVLLASIKSCSPEPSYHSQVRPETFFDNQDKVYQRMGRPFTHWSWFVADQGPQSTGNKMNEFTADGVLLPARYNDWYDGGQYIELYQHTWTPSNSSVWGAWSDFSRGYAEAISAKDDIDMYADFDVLQFPTGTRESVLMQLQTLMAYFTLTGLDLFGGVPIYESNLDEPKARATDQDTFNYIEDLLKEALVSLPKKSTLGAAETGNINQAAAAGLLMRLYFNAKAYIGKEMYTETAEIAQDIIDGVYGTYDLDNDWRDVFGFGNETSPEIIWTCASEPVATRSVGLHGYHYRFDEYWQNSAPGNRNNGFCLVPSLDKEGKSYLYGATDPSSNGTFRLGSPFAKFHAKDVRKQLHAFDPETQWFTGMFYFGPLINPYTGATCTGGNRQFFSTDVMNMVDQIARISDWSEANAPEAHGNEGARWAEENSGVRLGKTSPIPTREFGSLMGTPDIPVMRMAEIYYTLAECKWRAGDSEGAASLINKVRARYFDGTDPDPVPADFDQWRLLDEWLVEFLGEGRRRQDLIRFDHYTETEWWDHKPSESYRKRFPIPSRAINGNQLLEQNPGYN